jgi:hypothetical protein
MHMKIRVKFNLMDFLHYRLLMSILQMVRVKYSYIAKLDSKDNWTFLDLKDDFEQ